MDIVWADIVFLTPEKIRSILNVLVEEIVLQTDRVSVKNQDNSF